MEHAVSENVIAGNVMTRRASYMYGNLLPKDPKGQVGAGLGQTTSTGLVTLIAPTDDITHTGQKMVIDGLEIEFQMTPGTEAPAEMNFLFPKYRALCMAENCTHNMHNLYTLRGRAGARSPKRGRTILTRRLIFLTAVTTLSSPLTIGPPGRPNPAWNT